MNQLTFSLAPFVTYHLVGHFEAPISNWHHMSRALNDYELIFVTAGTLYIADDKNEYEVHAGQYLIMSPTVYQHGTRSSDCSFHWLHFCENKGEHVQTVKMACQGNLPHPSRISVLFTQLYDLVHTTADEYARNLAATGILYEIYLQSKDEPHTEKGTLVYQKILDYINWNNGYRITVQEIAKHIGYHPKYISTVFHQLNGCTLKKYLTGLTMEYAKSMLVSSPISIHELAEEMGYTDAHNFSSAFKTSVGISPGEYRRSYKELEHNRY